MDNSKLINFCGKKMWIREIAKIYGISYYTLRKAYALTSDIDEAIDMCLNQRSAEDYELQEDTVSIDKLKHLAYSFDETGLKVDHTLLNNRRDPVATVEDKMIMENLKQQIATLTVRQQEVLRLRYGLDDGCFRTLEDVGSLMGVCHNDIRQIEGNAMRKLRRPQRVKYFNEKILDESEELMALIKAKMASRPSSAIHFRHCL